MEAKILFAIYFAYSFLKIFLAISQISFVSKRAKNAPELLDTKTWKEAALYELQSQKLLVLATLWDLVFFGFWVFFWFFDLYNALNIENQALKTIVFLDIFLIANSLINMPFSIYSKFVIEENFGFNKSSFGLFVKDTLKEGILGLVLINVLIFLLVIFITNVEFWWLWSFACLFGFVLLANMLYPTIRALLFDKFESIDNTDLGVQIRDLIQKGGFKISGVFKVDASKRDSRANAYFGGLGKTKRVILFDSLIEKLSIQELLAVLGHELGHFAHKDIVKNIVIMAGLLFGILFIFGNIPASFFQNLGLGSTSGLILCFFIFMPVLFFVFMPFVNFVSKHNEFGADEFGGNLVSKKDLASALEKLSIQNKKFPFSSASNKFFYETHPSVIERIKKLND